MNNRLGQTLPETLTTTLQRLQRDFTELKQRQLTSGRSGVLGYVSDSGQTYDYDQTLSTTGGALLTATFTVQFTRLGLQPYPIVRPFVEIIVNGVTLTRNDNGTLAYNDGTNSVTVGLSAELKELASTVTDPDHTNWNYAFTYMGTVHVQMKVRTAGTSRGTVGLTRVS